MSDLAFRECFLLGGLGLDGIQSNAGVVFNAVESYTIVVIGGVHAWRSAFGVNGSGCKYRIVVVSRLQLEQQSSVCAGMGGEVALLLRSQAGICGSLHT